MIQIPVYDGMGNIIGYLQIALSQLTDPYVMNVIQGAANGGSSRIEGNYIIFYDANGSAIGRLPLASLMSGQKDPLNPDFPNSNAFTFVPLPPTQGGGGTTTTGGGTTTTGGGTTTTGGGTTTTGGGTTTTTTTTGGGGNSSSTTTTTTTNTPIVPTPFPPIPPTGGTGTTTTFAIKPITWDDTKPCPTVLRLDYKISHFANKTTIDLTEITNPLQSYLSSVTFGEYKDGAGRKIRKYGVLACDLLKKIVIPSDQLITLYNTTPQTGIDPFTGVSVPISTIKFEADIDSSNTKNIGIRDGLTDANSTPTYFDRLCDLMKKQSFANGVRTNDMYVVFDYEFTDSNGDVHKVYATARVYIDANGNCVCVEEKLEHCDCKRYTLSIRNLRIVSDPRPGFDYPPNHQEYEQWYNENLPKDKQKVCYLKSDVFRCCTDASGNVLSTEKVGELLHASSYQSTRWEACTTPDGKVGQKIKVTQYFLMEELVDGKYLQFRYDPVFTSKPRNVGFRFPTNSLLNEIEWSDCDSSGKKTSFSEHIGTKLTVLPATSIQNFEQTKAEITSQTGRKVNSNPSWRPNGPIVINGVLVSNPPEMSLVLSCGSDEGECIPEPPGPPPPPPPPPSGPTQEEKYCIRVTSFDIANLIDEGRYILAGGQFDGLPLPAATHTYNSAGVYPIVIPAVPSANQLAYGYIKYEYADGSRSIRTAYDGAGPRPIQGNQNLYSEYYALRRFLEGSKEYFPGADVVVEQTGRVKLNRSDLVTEDGTFLQSVDCKTGGYIRKQRTSIPTYYQFEICYTIEVHNPNRNPNDPIQLRLKEQPKVTQIIGSFTEPNQLGTEYWIFDPAIPFEYDQDCCSGLSWPKNRGPIVTVSPPGVSNIGNNTPVKPLPYLDHKMDTAQYNILIDSCGCQAVDMADIWCYYESEPKSLWKKASKDDKDTWIRGPYIIPDEKCMSGSTVYHPFDISKDISYSNRKIKTKGLFNGSQTLDCYLTSSTLLSSSTDYYYNVTDCEDCDRIPYFAVAYGNTNGSGSYYVGGDKNNLKKPTDAIYSQYQLLCNEPTRSADGVLTLPKFSFVSESVNVESDDIYVINYYRNGLLDQLDPGNFQINMAYLSGSFYANNVHTGSNVKVGSPFVMKFIDDSDDFAQTHTCLDDPHVSYPIVSGSLQEGKYQDASINTYGSVYPYLGVVVFHPKRLNEQLGFNTVTGSNIYGDNAYKLFTSISGAASPFTDRSGSHKMLARNVVYKTTQHYSVRVNRSKANYSNNPTYVSGSKNRIFDKCFIHEPNTYITSVGLYNEELELLAIGKMTKPLKKDFDTDLLIKIRLNW